MKTIRYGVWAAQVQLSLVWSLSDSIIGKPGVITAGYAVGAGWMNVYGRASGSAVSSGISIFALAKLQHYGRLP